MMKKVLPRLLAPLARRFIAGETLEEALAVSRRLGEQGFAVILDLLGEHVTRREAAEAAARAYGELVERLAALGDAQGLDAMIALKPTHMGLELGQAFCLELLRAVTAQAHRCSIRVGLDMEDASTTDATLAMYRILNREFPGSVRVALQARLKRSSADLEALLAEGGRVRLVKGAYREPAEIAHTRMKEIRAHFQRLLERLLREGRDPAIATHDPVLLEAAKDLVQRLALEPQAFEFQMLYGIRPDLQRRLLEEGYRVRIYVPFGPQWFPYTLRRVRERPWYLWLALRSFFR